VTVETAKDGVGERQRTAEPLPEATAGTRRAGGGEMQRTGPLPEGTGVVVSDTCDGEPRGGAESAARGGTASPRGGGPSGANRPVLLSVEAERWGPRPGLSASLQ